MAGVTRRDVQSFWKKQPFDLRLPNINGKTPLGNCDGCFLKSEKNRAHLARYYPERAKWWADIEADGMFFSPPGEKRTWGDLMKVVHEQPDWVFNLTDAESPFCVTSGGGCMD